MLYKFFTEKGEGAFACSLQAIKVENWKKSQLIKKEVVTRNQNSLGYRIRKLFIAFFVPIDGNILREE